MKKTNFIFIFVIIFLVTATSLKAENALIPPSKIKVTKNKMEQNIKYEASLPSCKITWNVFTPESLSPEAEGTIASLSLNKKNCPYPLESQLPLHKAILTRLLGDQPFFKAHMTLGLWSDPKIKDWGWSQKMALACFKDEKCKDWYKHGMPTTSDENKTFITVANKARIYENLAQIFEKHGYTFSLKSMEKVMALRVNELPFSNFLKQEGVIGNPKLMFDAGASYFVIEQTRKQK